LATDNDPLPRQTMKIFVYEFVTGGGMWACGQRPTGSLLREGQAMARAILEDFATIADAEVLTMRDARLEHAVLPAEVFSVHSQEEERQTLRRLAREADVTLLIAPEFDGHLYDRAAAVEQCGGVLISPGSELIAIAASKSATASRLRSCQVPVPIGAIFSGGSREVPAGLCWPAVLKPDDGAGSLGIVKLQFEEDLLSVELPERGYLESFHQGIPASCAVLCGPRQRLALPACSQRLGGESGFEYLGGTLPLASELNARAQRLAVRVVECLPRPRGYIGVDLVLGEDPDGSQDVVIEVNPRLTTSYVGLRQLCQQNLAAAMLRIATGGEAALSFQSQQVEFRADGAVVANT
jgi:predicted ATP-grasp superfamily ATP-dependent carboligase